jgi:hypothetical protein
MRFQSLTERLRLRYLPTRLFSSSASLVSYPISQNITPPNWCCLTKRHFKRIACGQS